jgi:uncharacterized protein (TIGR03067 family)
MILQMLRCAVLLVLLAAAPDDAVTSQSLQGTWKGARFTEGGGENAAQGVKVEFTFKDSTLVGRKESGVTIGEATFSLSEQGRNIDATGTAGGYKGKTYPGILKLEGDKLWWCVSGGGGKDPKRPGSFVANPGAAQYLIVLARQK